MLIEVACGSNYSLSLNCNFLYTKINSYYSIGLNLLLVPTNISLFCSSPCKKNIYDPYKIVIFAFGPSYFILVPIIFRTC